MAKATYYIRIDTYWQNSADSFVGPFASRDEAQAEIESAMDDGKVCMAYHMAADIKSGIRVHEVLSKTQAKRQGMTAGQCGEGNMIGKRIPRNTGELSRMKQLD